MRPVLVIACGDAKRSEPSLVRDLYLGPLWSTYRKWRRDRGLSLGQDNPFADVWVVSAKHGLLREGRLLEPYNERLTPDRVDALAATLAPHPLARRPLTFAGPTIYGRALRCAGYTVEDLGGTGWGGMRQNLRRWLDGLARAPLDLDALIEKHRS